MFWLSSAASSLSRPAFLISSESRNCRTLKLMTPSAESGKYFSKGPAGPSTGAGAATAGSARARPRTNAANRR